MNIESCFSTEEGFRNAFNAFYAKDNELTREYANKKISKNFHSICVKHRDSPWNKDYYFTFTHCIYHPCYLVEDVCSKVYQLFESVRKHIECASKQYQIAVEIPFVKGSTTRDVSNVFYHRISYKTLTLPNPSGENTKQDLSQEMVTEIAIPMLGKFLESHGFTYKINNESVVFNWSEEVNPFNPRPKAPEINPVDPLGILLIESFKSEESTDTVFVCKNGIEIKVHKLVLQLRSGFFKRLFNNKDFKDSNSGIIDLKVFDSKTVQAAVEHMYTWKNPFETDAGRDLDLIDMIYLANYWELETLREYAAIAIGKNISPEQLGVLKNLSEKYDSDYLRKIYDYFEIRFQKK
jgi:hypothetical protein